MNWNPIRWWQKKRNRNEIDAFKSRWLPEAYDLGKLRWEARLVSSNNGDGNAFPETSHDGTSARAGATETSRLWVGTDLKLAAGEASMLYGIGIWEQFTSIDTHVYDAMSKLAKANVENILDLNRSLGAWKHDIWGVTDKALDKLKGHVGEETIAEALKQGGADVNWAPDSNTPGWDLIVGGHEINVKTVQDASSLYEHFSKYPDVSVAVPDGLHLPSGFDQFHFSPRETTIQSLHDFLASDVPNQVIVVDGVSAGEIAQHTHTAAHLASHGISAHEAVSLDAGHIPWITVATAGWREYKLYIDDKTDMAHAVKNLGADVAGRAGGGFLGAKAGAVVGSFAGPIGTAVGAVIGAVGGAMGGASVAGNYKRRELKEAIEQYKMQATQLEEAQHRVEQDANAMFSQARRNEEMALRAIEESSKRVIEVSQNSIVEHQTWARKISRSEWELLLGDAQKELFQEIERTKARYHAYSWFKRWVATTPEVIADEELLLMLSTRLTQIRTTKVAPPRGRPYLFAWLAANGYMKEHVSAWCQQFERKLREFEASYRDAVLKAQIHAIDTRIQATKRLNMKKDEIASQVKSRLAKPVEEVRAAAIRVRTEKGRLGLT